MHKETKSPGLEYWYHEGEQYCTILRDSFQSGSISFFTPDEFSQQLGYLPHKKGATIRPHLHKVNRREVLYTNEVLFVKTGRVRVNLYDKAKRFVGSDILEKGDFILLCGGGHGFEILEDTVMIEVKQGPYMGLDDKERFDGVEAGE